MYRRAWLLGLMICLVAACKPSANVEQERKTLTEVDRAWSQATSDTERFVSYFAPEASIYAHGMSVVTGAGPIRDFYSKMSSMPGFSLQWSPVKAEVSAAGDLGYTAGTYQMTVNDAAGSQTTDRGKYVTVWKKTAGGEWKVAEDIFNSDETPKPPASPHVMMATTALTWGDPPPSLPAGSKLAVVAGDPGKVGPFTIRAQFPAGYKIPPHWHPSDEHVTVLSGTLALGMGEKFDEAAMESLPAGGYALLPAEMRHFAMAKTPVTIQVHGMGPFVINYINPEDDPSRQAK